MNLFYFSFIKIALSYTSGWCLIATGQVKQFGRNAKRNIEKYELTNNERSAMSQALLEYFSGCVLFLKWFFLLLLLVNNYICESQFISHLFIIQFTNVTYLLLSARVNDVCRICLLWQIFMKNTKILTINYLQTEWVR